jgi:protein farnesyltransferase/geranylgeranyltransferase type-1 subunit alpha
MALDSPLDDELDLMDDIAVEHMKTYQVWHHRRLIITKVGATSPFRVAAELAFIASALSEDAKNYHTWSYRQWLLAHFNRDDLWDGELGYVDAMLRDDIRNNSAWHHRFFVVFESGVRKGDEDREAVLKREIM